MKKIVFVVLLLMTITSAYAQQPIPVQVQQCVACHAINDAMINPEWPLLSGQHPVYLLKQLSDIKKGSLRQAPLMSGILATLSDADLKLLADFYATLSPMEGRVPAKYLERGQELYRGGDMKKHISACIACHGPRGRGNNEAGFPALSGQLAPYTIKQLQAFKTHVRKNDLNHIMQDISTRMSDDDIIAAAYYVQGLY